MRRRKDEPTVAEHLRFGRAVKDFHLALHRMATGTESGLGVWRFPKTSAESRAIRKAEAALAELMNVMDNKICGALGVSAPYGKDATRFYYSTKDPQP